MMEYSKDGETSYLLNGVTTKENLLKERESLLKKFLYNPQTNRYDYDGNLYKNDLGILVSEDKDGFIINFGKITGNFNCYGLGLTSLKGAPTEVGEDFYCPENLLTSLEGAPQTVGRDFNCSSNQLTSLKGAPQTVGRDFYCFSNQLTLLEGAPQTVGKTFDCSRNQLTSLKGVPTEIGGDFYCYSNPNLHSLEGIGKVKGYIYKDF